MVYHEQVGSTASNAAISTANVKNNYEKAFGVIVIVEVFLNDTIQLMMI